MHYTKYTTFMLITQRNIMITKVYNKKQKKFIIIGDHKNDLSTETVRCCNFYLVYAKSVNIYLSLLAWMPHAFLHCLDCIV